MTPDPGDAPVELDQVLAPFLLAYTVAVVGALAAVIAWVYWYRGYA